MHIFPPLSRILRAAIFASVLLVLLSSTGASAQSSNPLHPVSIYLFWGDGCPHCAAAKPFLDELTQRYSAELHSFEVWYAPENQALFQKMAAAFNFEAHSVPTIFVGDQHWEGYSDQVSREIEAAVKDCALNGCRNSAAGIIPGIVESSPPEEQQTSPAKPSDVIDIPLIGQVHLAAQSLWVSTALISFVDGVNPCSIWVLTMLLAITLHTGSRKKVLLIGLIFLTVTAGIYALFIAGLFTMFTIISFVGWIQVVVALAALFFAGVNIKDYFWYKEGISFTIADDKKPGIYQRMRKLVDASQSFWGLAGATVVMAAGVSLVEFSCTAGFPVIWTNLLVSQSAPALTFIALLLLYLVIYQLDEMVIFGAAVFSLKSSKLEEKHGRLLKLMGGMLMLTLAMVMLVNPALMNTLSSSIIIFGLAILATLLVLLFHRVLFPRWGILIGTEFRPKKRVRTASRRR